MIYPRVDLFDLCKISDMTFWPMFRQELSREWGGATQAIDRGSALWRASFTTAPARRADAAAIEAALISLNGSAGSFLAHDVRRPYPKAYAAGVFADTGSIGALDGANAFMLGLAGLPAGFVLSPGDYLSFDYGTRPSKALHMVMQSATADGLGATPNFEVFPAIRPGALVGAAVTLKKPACEMILEPGQSPPALRDIAASSVGFSAVQIL